MDGYSYPHDSYKLRSSGAVPFGPGRFLAQTFGVDKNRVTTWEATTTLPRSDDFMGATIGAKYMQASFQRLPYLNDQGRQLFSGTITEKTEFLDQDYIPGARRI